MAQQRRPPDALFPRRKRRRAAAQRAFFPRCLALARDPDALCCGTRGIIYEIIVFRRGSLGCYNARPGKGEPENLPPQRRAARDIHRGRIDIPSARQRARARAQGGDLEECRARSGNYIYATLRSSASCIGAAIVCWGGYFVISRIGDGAEWAGDCELMGECGGYRQSKLIFTTARVGALLLLMPCQVAVMSDNWEELEEFGMNSSVTCRETS